MPDDDWFDEINPLLWKYLYESWLYKQERQQEQQESLAILIGSFSNMEMAKKMIKTKNPDHSMTDEDFEKLSEEIAKTPYIANKKRKKKIIIS